ncbi:MULTISPECIES: phosphoglycolate phosphatase [unclassified Phyllobacterium]|uniref:phosphoglycolate phosphatase n=2 Tax=Phyllobacterium TaxID=28100 RepID=UPI000DD9AB98|nr:MULTISPECIES: phosphoglycolate phosphatase [unclassified Phyllobacterium]MBA8902144.1 phosphoglycolate phosphatase [Phyllobacterium sp. P30BS-XVII]UGX86900.1 phosphoglycolate phosphatase [Phyllobacterium sp. T1293]
MSKPIVVFDLDGTLVDTAPDLLDSLNHCLHEAGMQKIDPVALRRYVGQGGRVMIERAFEAQQKMLSPEQLDWLVGLFLEHYSKNMPGHSALYEGVEAVMDDLSKAGYLLAVCTNKFEGLSVSLLTALGQTSRFAAICGSDTFAFRKPDPRHLFETIAKAGGDRDRALMVGDSHTDIDTAKAAGIPVIAVDFGYSDLPVSTYEPSKVISHYRELNVQLAERLINAVNA